MKKRIIPGILLGLMLATALASCGEDGHTPEITIGDNGNWYVDGVDQGVFDELKFSSGVLYPPPDQNGMVSDWYPQLVFRNHLNQVIMLYVNKKDKLIMFNYDNVTGSKLSLGKVLGSNVKEFLVRRDGSSVIEYKLTFEIDKKDFIVSNRVTLVNVF